MSVIQQSVVKLPILGSPVQVLHFNLTTEIFWVFIKSSLEVLSKFVN